jgi:MscS family membrane protein
MQTTVQELLASRHLENHFLQALVVLLAAFVASRFVEWFLSRVVTRLTRRTRTDLDDRMVELLHLPVRNSVLLAGLGVASELLALPAPFDRYTLSLLKTLAVLIWLGFGVRFSSLLLGALAAGRDRLRFIDGRTLPLFDNLAKVVLIGGGIYFLFLAWDVDVTAWLASAGIIGIAVGFAAKDTLANLFAGVFISADAPYKVGDIIVLDSGERGRVTHVGIRSTRLLTRDDIEITIPNSVIANTKIVNESGGPSERERLRIQVGVAYGSDVDRVRQVLLEVAAAVEHVCRDPEPRVRFRSFGDSSLNFELLVWIDEPVQRGVTQDALNTAVYKRFQADGIEIPYPKRDVYVRELPRRSS